MRVLSMTVAALHKRMNQRFTHLGRRMGARFTAVDGRFEQVDARFEQVDARFEQVDTRFTQVDRRFEQVDARFDRLEARMQAGFESVHDQINAVMRVMSANHTEYLRHFDLIEKRLQDLEEWRRRSEHSGRTV
jgi:chromosome segregation ATPase